MRLFLNFVIVVGLFTWVFFALIIWTENSDKDNTVTNHTMEVSSASLSVPRSVPDDPQRIVGPGHGAPRPTIFGALSSPQTIEREPTKQTTRQHIARPSVMKSKPPTPPLPPPPSTGRPRANSFPLHSTATKITQTAESTLSKRAAKRAGITARMPPPKTRPIQTLAAHKPIQTFDIPHTVLPSTFVDWQNPGLPETPFDFSIQTMFKNEARYLAEWVEYHLCVGFQHFFLYNDNSTDNWRDVLAPYRAYVTVEDVWGKDIGHAVKDKFITDHRKHTKWCAINLNVDEFVYIVDHKPISEFMEAYRGQTALLAFWLMFGSSGHVTRPAGLVLENYLMVASQPDLIEISGKVIAQTARVVKCHGHNSFYSTGHAVDVNMNKIDDGLAQGYQILSEVTTDKIRINHYRTKSQEDMMARWARGQSVDNNISHIAPKTERDKRLWIQRWDRNDVNNTDALYHLPCIREGFEKRPPVSPGPGPTPLWFSVQYKGLCVDVANAVRVGVLSCSGARNASQAQQAFSLTPPGLLVSRGTHRCLGAVGGRLSAMACDASDARQVWAFYNADGAAPPPDLLGQWGTVAPLTLAANTRARGGGGGSGSGGESRTSGGSGSGGESRTSGGSGSGGTSATSDGCLTPQAMLHPGACKQVGWTLVPYTHHIPPTKLKELRYPPGQPALRDKREKEVMQARGLRVVGGRIIGPRRHGSEAHRLELKDGVWRVRPRTEEEQKAWRAKKEEKKRKEEKKKHRNKSSHNSKDN